MKPEFRIPPLIPAVFFLPIGLFWYGWSADKQLHWIMPIIGTGWIGVGMIISFVCASSACQLLRSKSLLTNISYRWRFQLISSTPTPSIQLVQWPRIHCSDQSWARFCPCAVNACTTHLASAGETRCLALSPSPWHPSHLSFINTANEYEPASGSV